MAQLLMGMPRQPFKQSSTFQATGENDPASQLFDQFCSANTFHGIMDTFQQLCDIIGLRPVDHQIFYKQLKTRLLSWKAQSLWTKLDKRAANLEYKKGTACNKTRALVIGSGPCGLRVAIEIALLGGKVVIVEKREGFSRNNVLHLWPFLIHDLKALGAKKFFGKFCAGAIDHISIRALQCILLKVALLVGVEVHSGVAFEGFSEPPSDQTKDKIGWRAKVTPADHPVAEFVFDVCISSDGKRNTMTEFKRKEFRGKLAIAITANFINRNTTAEASVEEISGVAYIFNQKFFKDLNRHAGIDLENIVYYKDETHYFVMTAKKQSLLCKGVLLQDYDDPEILLSKENVDQHALLEYARQAADMSTQHRLPNLEFAHNHYGQPDVAMFDFTSMFAAEHACRVVERQGYRLLVGLVGDTLLEPFWPTGSGCARGFLGAFDAAWMIRSWASGKMTPLEVIAERESIYQLLSQTTPENLNKNYLQYTIDPNTRYLNLNVQVYKPHQVSSKYDGHDTEYLSDIVRQAVQQSHRYDSMRDSHNMLKWIQRQLESYQSIVKVVDLSISWHSGMALCALIHHHRPELLDVYSLDPNRVEANNQLAFDVVEKEFGIAPIMTGQEMAQRDAPDKATMAAYLARICSLLRKETTSLTKTEDKGEAASKARLISLTKIGNRIRQRREEMERNDSGSLKRFQDPINLYDVPSKRVKDLYDANTVLNTYDRVENLEMTFDDLSKYSKLQKELRLLGSGVRGQNKVSVLAKDLASKLSGEGSKPSEESAESSGKAHPTDICYFCKNRVYTVERYTAEGLLFHRGCFRCDYCGSPLRISYYSYKALGNGEGKFYCVQHHGLQRSTASSSGQAISALNRDVSSTKYAISPPKISSITESYLRCPGKDPTTVKRTPERVEYVTESEVEESEYEQTKHNLCSVLRPSAFSDSDSSSSEEELHFSDEDASDEQPDLSWAELARMYTEQQRQTRRTRLPQKRTSSASSGSETETVEGASDADWETDSNTDKENIAEESENGQSLDVGRAFRGERPKGSRDAFSKHLLSLSPKQIVRHETKPSPTSVEIMRNRMAFFSTVSQPVRIDARVFLGLAPPPLGAVIQIIEAQEDLMDAQIQVEAGGEDGSKGKKADEENLRLENRKEERPSKRHAEKKPVIQKAKKRTKRRKKDEKSRVTADVESTRLSTMHEAVPVVSISGATSSDEQDGRLEVENKAAAEITSISEENVNIKPDGNSGDDNMEERERTERPEPLDESLGPDVQRKRCSAEEGESSRSKSGGSQASENSQTLQYSDSDELLSPRGDLLSGEAMLDSKAEGVGDVVETEDGRNVVAVVNGVTTEAVGSVADVGTAKVSNGNQEDSAKVGKPKRAEDDSEEVLRIEELDRDGGECVHGAKKISKVQTAQSTDVHEIRRLDDEAMHEETDEVSDEQKLEHEYVVLEEVLGEGEGGKFSPYEELVTDGSDKEYTKIEFGPSQAESTKADRVLSQGQERIEDDEVLVLAAKKESDILVRQECAGIVNDFSVSGAPFDVSLSTLKSDDVFEAGALSVPGLAPRAECESYSDEDGNMLGRSCGQTKSAGALLPKENGDILQGLSGDGAKESHLAKVIPEKVASKMARTADEFKSEKSLDSTECVSQGLQSEKQKSDERTVAAEENVHLWSEVVDNLEDLKKKEIWPVTSSEVLVETGVCSTLQLEFVPEQHIKKVPMEEMGPAWSEVAENLEAVEIRETWPVTTEEMSDETGVIASQAAPAYSKPLEMACNLKDRDTVPTQALSAADLQSCPDNGFVSGNLKTSIGEPSLDPLARINLLLESLSVNKEESGPVSSGDFIRHQTKPEQTLPGSESEATVTDDTKKERPNSLIISEDDQRNGNTSSTDAVARLAPQTKLIDSSGRKTEKPSRNDLSSDSSICNASTTSGSVDFMSSLLQESAHASEQLRSPTDDSISDGRQGTSLAFDDGTSSIDQLASGSLSEDVLSLENVAEVNIEGEDLADLEVEVWPRVILENKSVGDQALSKRLELEATNKESNLLSNATETPCSAETSERKNEVQNIQVESASLPGALLIGQNSDHSSVSLASNSSASSVLSPNRIMDAKRRFFRETAQPLRIDPRKVIRDIPSTQQQQVLAKEFSGEESSLISGEFDSASDRRSGVASVLSSGSERGVENVSHSEISNEIQSSPLPAEEIEKTVSEVERKRQLPTVPTNQSSQPSLPSNIGAKGPKQTYLQKASSSGSDKGRVLISEAEARSKKHIFKERKRPNSAFVVMEESWRSSGKSKGSPVGLSRPMSAKPVPPPPSLQKTGSPVLGAEAGHTRMQASQSDGASTEEASPSLVHKDKENRLKSFYQQRTKGKDSVPTVIKEVHDKKDKKKSLLALLIPSRSLEKKEKATKSPVLQSKSRTPGESSKLSNVPNMAVVREKTKSLPLEKKQAPLPIESKKAAGDKSLLKGKHKSKPGKVSEEPAAEIGHSIYKEMAGIMEGIKKVEKRNRDKNSIRDRIEAVAPPPAKAPYTVLLPPKADIEDFETESEFGDDRLSLRSFQSQMHLLSEEEAAKMKKRQQKVARKKQREKELKRLYAAQEVQQQLEEVELRQREIERQGVEIEKALSGEGTDHSRDETNLVQQWFDIVYERNVLMRYESELMVQARELELEDRQSRLEIQLRERIPNAESQRSESLKEEEQRILEELMEVVEQRDALVALLEEDRIRQQQYSKNLERIMVDRGFQLSSISHVHLPQALASLQEDR